CWQIAVTLRSKLETHTITPAEPFGALLFRLPTLAISRMTIHGRLRIRKIAKNVLTSCDVVGDNPLPTVKVKIPMGTLTHETAVSRAKEIADRVLAPLAAQNDKSGRFSTEAVDALSREELLGLMVPTEAGGSGLGPRTFAVVVATLGEADATVAMVYLMHVLGAAAIAAARPGATV